MSGAPTNLSDSGIPVHGNLPDSAAGIVYANIVDKLLGLYGKTGTALITSLSPGDGKTTAAVNLTLAFRAKQLPVFLIELAVERPQLAEIFGKAPAGKGVEDVLSGTQNIDALMRLQPEGHHLATVHSPQPSAALLQQDSELIEQRLGVIPDRSHWTLLDGPALDDFTGPGSILPLVFSGLVILVVKTRSTPLAVLQKALTYFEKPPMILLNEGE